MLLHELDEDALSIIVSYLSPVREDVINLALTCRAFYPITKYPEHISITCPSPQYTYLTDLLIADPMYSSSARSAHIRVQATFARHNIATLFERLPNLRSLTFDANRKPRYMNILLSKDLPFKSTLRYLKVVDSTLGLEDLLSLLAFPELRYLELPLPIKDFSLGSLNNSVLFFGSVPQLRYLRSLHLGIYRSLCNEELMMQILSRCPVLESLQSTFEPHQFPLPYPTWRRSYHRMQEALSYVSQSLVHLKLFHSGGFHHCRKYESGLDLSSLSNLKTLEAAAEFLLPPLTQGSRNGFFELLPRNIETLKICFGRGTCVFIDRGFYTEMTYIRPSNYVEGELDPSVYRWMIELAEMKRDRFPFLHKVEFLEDDLQNKRPLDLKHRGLPTGISRAFEEARVELSITARIPRGVVKGS